MYQIRLLFHIEINPKVQYRIHKSLPVDLGDTRFFWEVVSLERGPLSLVRITEELLERKVAAPI
jgi:hypothetical protein